MQAAEAKIQKVLEGSKQFLIPHYQRPYSWKEAQWTALWRDFVDLLEHPEQEPHFLGSIVSSPARSVPEGIEKRLLIDGQQRLTTILTLLTVLRDRARDAGSTKLADKIQDLVTNRHEEGHEQQKLLPTQSEDPDDSDRETYIRLVAGTSAAATIGIGAAYHFFDAKLRRPDAPDLETLFRTIVTRLTLVSIILDDRDNPHRIFESLNGKGRPLSQVDLIRNYFFMRIPEGEHERVYVDLWRPMQRRLGEEALPSFVRHYLMRTGQIIRETDVYSALKKLIDEDRARGPVYHLKELARFAGYYEFLLKPNGAPTATIGERIARLNRMEVTVAYPLLLSVFADHAAGTLDEPGVLVVLDALENYLVRRFVCGVPTHGLNKIFAPLYEQATRGGEGLVAGVQQVLAANRRAYPTDDQFRGGLTSARLYGAGDRRDKTKLLLERLETAFQHKEAILFAPLTIEHVMPQKLSDAWKAHLGPSAEEDHEELLHTLGNLTLTSYNAELSNEPFEEKRKLFATSHVEMNRYLAGLDRWTAEAIEQRAGVLADKALALWPYFGSADGGAVETAADSALVTEAATVTGTAPRTVRVRQTTVPVQSWVDVAVATVEGILAVGAEEFDQVVAELPRFVNSDATAFRRSSRLRKLTNGAYVATNLSASHIYRLCLQAAQIAGLGLGEWQVEVTTDEDNEDGTSGPVASPIRQLQQQFWVPVREALLATGQFPSLQAARPQSRFNIPLGRGDFFMSLTANTDDRRIGVKVVLRADVAEKSLEGLLARREAIEREIGAALQWNPYPEKRQKTIALLESCDVTDRATWPAAIAWLVKTALAFRSAFALPIADFERKPGK